MTPAARASFSCCALRADDAERVRPVCGDTVAARFLDDEVRARLRPSLTRGNSSASSVARHRLIDDAVRDSLVKEPSRRIILLGAGFDTRAFRLPGGRWWEFDSPEVIDFKEQRLPAASAPNPLTRVAADIVDGPWQEQLAAVSGHDEACVVLEGVSMYMTRDAFVSTLRAVRTHLPKATLICDLMTPAFIRRFSQSLRKEIGERVADPNETHRDQLIETAGYETVSHVSIVGRAREAGTVKLPGWLLATFLRELRDGYQVWTFRPT